jgi:hypothetical protein
MAPFGWVESSQVRHVSGGGRKGRLGRENQAPDQPEGPSHVYRLPRSLLPPIPLSDPWRITMANGYAAHHTQRNDFLGCFVPIPAERDERG